MDQASARLSMDVPACTPWRVSSTTPRLTRAAVLGLVMGLVALGGLAALICLPLAPLERGGVELARNLVGLTGLGPLGGAIGRPAVGWTAPFVWTAPR